MDSASQTSLGLFPLIRLEQLGGGSVGPDRVDLWYNVAPAIAKSYVVVVNVVVVIMMI